MTESPAERIDLGSLRYGEGYFLTRKVRREPYVPRDVPAGPYRHVFTYPGSGRTIKEAALELIGTARRKVFLASFLLGEADLVAALCEAAGRLRGGVYVVSELSDRSLWQKLAELEDAPDPDAATRTHKKNFSELTRRGIAVRGHPGCHAKFIVTDDRAALVSSANLDTNGLNSTGENGVVVTDPAEVDRLARFYTRLWDSCAYEMPPGSDAYSVRERKPMPARCRVPPPGVRPSSGVIWTHDEERWILRHLHDVIARARESLLLATYSLNGLTEDPSLLLEPLERAMGQHPLRVRLLCRGRNHVQAQRRDATALADLGVDIFADSLNHAKAAIADGRHGALFSANFDAGHGLLDGVETGVRLDRQAALTEAARYFDHAIDNADLAFSAHPSQRDLDQRLAARWRAEWPHEPVLKVNAADRTWRGFCHAARTPPVLYTSEPDGQIRLHAGDSSWMLSSPTGDGVRLLDPAGTGGGEAAALLAQWLSPPRGAARKKDGTRRGFCPAVLRRVRGAR